MSAAKRSAARSAPVLSVPDLPAECSARDAALAYASAGWYVGPLAGGSKNPGSVLGPGWPERSTCDPDEIEGYWPPGTDRGVYLHAGRSNAVIFDVDHPDRIPPLLVEAIAESEAPFQSTRRDVPRKGHYVFAAPGVEFGNSPGDLGSGWGEVRARNGVIVVEPSAHAKAGDGGRYRWEIVGDVPELPADLAAALVPAGESIAAANDAQVERFLARHTEATHPHLQRVPMATARQQIEAKAARHDAIRDALAMVCRDARAGLYAAEPAVDELREVWSEAIGVDRGSHAKAAAEFDRSLAFAVGAANADNAEARRARVERSARPDRVTARVQFADSIPPRQARWLWDELLPVGALSVLAGREGVGKSTLAYQLVADLSTGRLDGEFVGTPRTALVVATEDAWPETIIPRLTAAEADLGRVGKLSVERAGSETPLDLSLNIGELAAAISEHDAALLLLDPLMSRLGADLDTHKDADVRRDLEPLVAMAERTGCAVFGLMHFNKTATSDPLTAIMGSRAFAAVPRSVLAVMEDPDDPAVRLMGHAKSNLGPRRSGTSPFTIGEAWIEAGDGSKIKTSRLEWGVHDPLRSLREALADQHDAKRRPAVAQRAADWIENYLRARPGCRSELAELLAAAADEGFSRDQINKGKAYLAERLISTRAAKRGGHATWALAPGADRKHRPRRGSR